MQTTQALKGVCSKLFYLEYDQEKNSFINRDGTQEYKGSKHHTVPHGVGTIYYKNGNEMYIGELENGSLVGQGIWKTVEGVTMYKGLWRKNKPDGYGTLSDENYGDILYHGTWKDGLKSGWGSEKKHQGTKNPLYRAPKKSVFFFGYHFLVFLAKKYQFFTKKLVFL